jgi:hypothetical protein
VLDSALLRPGRFDRQVTVDRPDVQGRVAILKVYARGKVLSKDVDLDKVRAAAAPGAAAVGLARAGSWWYQMARADGAGRWRALGSSCLARTPPSNPICLARPPPTHKHAPGACRCPAARPASPAPTCRT